MDTKTPLKTPPPCPFFKTTSVAGYWTRIHTAIAGSFTWMWTPGWEKRRYCTLPEHGVGGCRFEDVGG